MVEVFYRRKINREIIFFRKIKIFHNKNIKTVYCSTVLIQVISHFTAFLLSFMNSMNLKWHSLSERYDYLLSIGWRHLIKFLFLQERNFEKKNTKKWKVQINDRHQNFTINIPNVRPRAFSRKRSIYYINRQHQTRLSTRNSTLENRIKIFLSGKFFNEKEMKKKQP